MSIVCAGHLSGVTRAEAGFTNIGPPTYEWWVCAHCRKPTAAWLLAQGETVLNYFRGGPADSLAYETKFLLLDPAAKDVPVQQYKWTPEIIVSAKTGAEARVWAYIGESAAAQDAAAVQDIGGSSADEDVTGGHDDMTAKKAPAAAKPAAAKPAKTDDAAGPLLERRTTGKFSRAQVAEAAGITVAQVYRIEKGGSRTTDEETANVTSALESLEAASDPA